MTLQKTEPSSKFEYAERYVIDVQGSCASNCSSLVAHLENFGRHDFFDFCQRLGLSYEERCDMSEDKQYDLHTELAYLDWRTREYTVLTVYDRGGRFRIGGHVKQDCIELAEALGLPVRR